MSAPHEEIVITPLVRGYSVRRYYDPQTGQFISVDPLVDQTESPYGYASQDPVNDFDPGGQKSCAKWSSFIGKLQWIMIPTICWAVQSGHGGAALPEVSTHINKHGQLTGGGYTILNDLQERHYNGTPRKSQFAHPGLGGPADLLTIKVAVYADLHNLWTDLNRVVLKLQNDVGWVGSGNRVTNQITVQRRQKGPGDRTRFVHGWPSL